MAPRCLDADVHLWDAWHPREAARVLAAVEAPWCVAAGWAIDLFLGEKRREHEDLEIAVPRGRFGEVAAALAEYELFVPAHVDGRDLVWPLQDAGERLDTHHQTWVREPATGLWRIDVFREPHDGDTWICRRDETIRIPYDEVIEHAAGIPFLRPEIVLLFKAKHSHQSKNETDFADTVPRLGSARRGWLGDALARVHPGHAWLPSLR